MIERKLPGLRPMTEPSDEINGELRQIGANELADRIRGAIGAGPFESVSVYAPPHRSRGDGLEVTYMPLTVEEFEHLRTLPREELERIGMRSWDGDLMLFPVEWFPLIPEGFPATCIDGTTAPWNPETADDDGRYGVLAYGLTLMEADHA